MASIKIDGKTMPELLSLDIEEERVWSSSTGRTADGTMKGSIVAYKTKLTATFVPMSDEEAKTLENAIHSAFFDVTYKDVKTNKEITKKFYSGSPKYPVYSYCDGLPRYVGVAIDFIQR